jgi:transposase
LEHAEVVHHYHDLWQVEQSFRFAKHDLVARPFFVRNQDAIEAQVTIVFAELAMTRTIYQRTGL